MGDILLYAGKAFSPTLRYLGEIHKKKKKKRTLGVYCLDSSSPLTIHEEKTQNKILCILEPKKPQDQHQSLNLLLISYL